MSDELKPYQASSHLTHGHTVGKKYSPTYHSWQSMIARCKYPGRQNSDRYFQIGIKVCERWKDFSNFLQDMGERPDGTTLDRYPDKNGNYEPLNCRWATPCEQARNTRKNVLTYETAVDVAVRRMKGQKCKEIAKLYGISESLPREIVKGRTWKGVVEVAEQIIAKERSTP